MTVLPGLIECHSHPLFAGIVMPSTGCVWAAPRWPRSPPPAAASGRRHRHARGLRRGVAGGAAVGLRADSRRRRDDSRGQVRLRTRPRASSCINLSCWPGAGTMTPAQPRRVVSRRACRPDRGRRRQPTRPRCSRRCPAVCEQGIAAFHDITCEPGLFTPAQAAAPVRASRRLDLPTKAHADAWASSHGWETAVSGRRRVGRAPHLHAGRGDRRRRRHRHRRGPAATGRARLHDRAAGECSPVDRPARCRWRSRPTTARRSTRRR